MCSRSICIGCFESQSAHLIWNTATGRSHASGNGTRELHSGDFKESIELIFNSFMVDEKEYWWLGLTSPGMDCKPRRISLHPKDRVRVSLLIWLLPIYGAKVDTATYCRRVNVSGRPQIFVL